VIDESGKLKGLNTVRVDWTKDSGGRWKMEEVPGSEQFYDAQLVFLALGFLGPESELVKSLGLKVDGRSNIQTPHKVCLVCRDSDLVGSTYAEIFDQHRGCVRCRRLSPRTIPYCLGYQVRASEI
jgi:NADPH-dependent glutamate synthase beta subunit-like oxidoreductase